MYDELTRGDVQKMQEEIDYRTQVLRPKLIEDVQTARAFGDLSENFESGKYSLPGNISSFPTFKRVNRTLEDWVIRAGRLQSMATSPDTVPR